MSPTWHLPWSSRDPGAAAPPAEVLGRAALPRGEKVLAAATTADGTWLLGTRERLVLVEERGVTWLAWERVEDAAWDSEGGRLRLRGVGDYGRRRPEWSWEMEEPPLLLQLLRERVTASIVLQRKVPVRAGQGVTVIARRSPVGGPVAWMHSYDAGLDPDDPEVQAVSDLALTQARSELGEAADGTSLADRVGRPGPI
ncbi:hypothetical protein ASG49_05250 [Marmoricola sp. Leaf446]|uniref:hypothetical protein n=1 Tax=Marmoricola sp. Leaf446 TaxID=1736379 RepID=UPI0006FEBB18|nr:hypothetical protein [Marmoricola sp. Leaf446]KQT94300.1 hypothetical protein ASG49_05250 [Marmoricola sp. Leaf446]